MGEISFYTKKKLRPTEKIVFQSEKNKVNLKIKYGLVSVENSVKTLVKYQRSTFTPVEKQRVGVKPVQGPTTDAPSKSCGGSSLGRKISRKRSRIL